jgi:hypothetical protein
MGGAGGEGKREEEGKKWEMAVHAVGMVS